MAKDGTARGGARVNSGPKKKISKPNLNDEYSNAWEQAI